MNEPIGTVIVPARNEEADIGGCIEAIAAQTYFDVQEVILVDGASTDATIEVARRVARDHGLSLRVIHNPARTAASSLNLGLASARGRVVIRVDARSRIQPHHVERCCELLDDPVRGVVGGGQLSRPRSSASLIERGIARSLLNRYTTGLARYRRQSAAGPTDTVWMGAFRREDLLRVGGWPTYPEQNQDYRLNQRIRSDGLEVWFDPTLNAEYLPRSTLRALAVQYFRFGRAKAAVWRASETPSPRHIFLLTVPVVGVVAALLSVRRWRPSAVVTTAAAGALVLDHIGVRSTASLPERVASILATITADASWYAGVLDGWARR